MEEYEQDKDGYRQMVDEDTTIELSREYDRVTGNEDLYRTLLSRLTIHAPASVTGNEGFFESVKSAAASGVQMVKDFFKWLWTFFTGKTVVYDDKAKELSAKLKKGLGPIKDVPYPGTYGSAYTKKGNPDTSINWINDAYTEARAVLAKVTTYIEDLKKFCNNAGNLLTDDKSDQLAKEIEQLHAAAKSTFKVTGSEPVKLFSNYTIAIDAKGEFTLKTPEAVANKAKKPVFSSDANEVEALLTKGITLNNDYKKHIEASTSLENVFLKALNKTLEAAKSSNPNANAPKEIQRVIRFAMSDIGAIEKFVQRSNMACLDVLNAAVNPPKKAKDNAA